MTLVLAAAGVLAPSAPSAGLAERGWLAINDGVIVERGTGPAPADAADQGDALLVAGFVDLQVNGIGGDDLATASLDGWQRAQRRLLAAGTTAFCPAFVSAPLDAYPGRLAAAAAARSAASKPGDLPVVLGAHLEGPFLGAAPGAHDPDTVRAADLAWLEELLDACPGEVAVVTLAPEADPELAATRLLVDRGVRVALGHTTATYDQCRAAADAGATLVTHLFNAMGPFHHRAPGIVGAALDDDRLVPSLIADLVHVHPAALRMASRASARTFLVSDAVAGHGPVARRPDRTLAGSTITLAAALRNAVAVGIPIARALDWVSRIPAEVLGLTDRGRLEPGARADIVALDPSTLAVRAVWLAGEPVPDRFGVARG